MFDNEKWYQQHQDRSMLLRIVQRETQFSFGMNQLSIKFRRFRYRTKSVSYQLVDSITNRTCDVAVEDNKMMIIIWVHIG